MLELPECYAIAKQLNEVILGKQIVASKFHSSPHKFAFYFGDYMDYPVFLKGKTVDKITQIGGNIEIELGFFRLVLGDGINLRFLNHVDAAPVKHQMLLEFEDGSGLAGTVQMYGAIQLFEDGQNTSHYYWFAKDKPNPLTDAFDEAYFMEMFKSAKPKLSTKAFLATEQRIPGLGNGVLQDILFDSRLHPKRKIGELSEAEIHQMYVSVKKIMKQIADAGGRDTEKDVYGQAGGYKTILSKKTVKEPCPVCGEGIVRQAYLGGNIYFCPRCQSL